MLFPRAEVFARRRMAACPGIPLFHGIKLVQLCRADNSEQTMTLDEAYSLIRASLDQMNARYGSTVFDEWAVLALYENAGRILHYQGPREDDFTKNFISDLGTLRSELTNSRYTVGDSTSNSRFKCTALSLN